MWLAPAPWRQYHVSLIRGGFRPYRDYSGNGMTDWVAHRFGAAMFADDPPATLAPVVGFQVSMVPLALAWPNQPPRSMFAPKTHIALEFCAVPSGQPDDWNGGREGAGRSIDHGTFALQGHDPKSTVYYKNIRVKPLP